MHYYIDGYNMLFRLFQGDDLQKQRNHLINDLNKKISFLQIDVSIVFDATFQIGDRSRSHFRGLELLFTAEGETADEYIIDEIKQHPHPQRETVVTSDKKLAAHVRRLSAKTESIEDFLSWINKSYQKKRKQEKEPPQPKQIKKTALKPVVKKEPVPSIEAKAEDCMSYYERVFQEEFDKILSEEETKKAKKRKGKKVSHHPKPTSSKQPKKNDMERWLETFEERLQNHDNSY